MKNKKFSNEEKVAKINGKFTLYAAGITTLAVLIGYFVKCEGDETKIYNTVVKDTVNKSVEIKNNSINQSNASNSNAQIGSENKSE